MSGSTSTVWSLPLTLRVNFWAMSAVSSWGWRRTAHSWRACAVARTLEGCPGGTLIQPVGDWNGYNDEILGPGRPPAPRIGAVEAFGRRRRGSGSGIWHRVSPFADFV